MGDLSQTVDLAAQRMRAEVAADLDLELVALLAKAQRLLQRMSECSLAEFSGIYSAKADAVQYEIGCYLKRMPSRGHRD